MGFWDSLFKSSSVNNTDGNYVAFRGVQNSQGVVNNHGFYEEYSSELYADTGGSIDNTYTENGVFLKEASDVFKLTYSGILVKDGAQDVYAVVGLDDNGSWKDIRYYPMHKTGEQAYEVLFPVRNLENINVAFKDGADHWDNNSGRNYTYR